MEKSKNTVFQTALRKLRIKDSKMYQIIVLLINIIIKLGGIFSSISTINEKRGR